jgi:hypothetical protein
LGIIPQNIISSSTIKKEVRSMIPHVLGQGTPVIASRFKAGLTVSITKNNHLSQVMYLRAPYYLPLFASIQALEAPTDN